MLRVPGRQLPRRGRLTIPRSTMKISLTALLLACTLSSAQAAKFHVAPECRKQPCRHLIAVCVNQACAGFHGIVKAGCKRAAHLTLVNACTVAGDYARFCNEQSSGNGCAPN